MYLVEISPNSALIEGRPIRLANAPKLMTNNNVTLNEDCSGLIIQAPGVYKIKMLLTVLSTSNGIGVSLRVDGDEVTTTEATFDDGEVGELVIDYPINVLHDEDGGHKVLIELHAMFAGEIYGGHVIVERVI